MQAFNIMFNHFKVTKFATDTFILNVDGIPFVSATFTAASTVTYLTLSKFSLYNTNEFSQILKSKPPSQQVRRILETRHGFQHNSHLDTNDFLSSQKARDLTLLGSGVAYFKCLMLDVRSLCMSPRRCS